MFVILILTLEQIIKGGPKRKILDTKMTTKSIVQGEIFWQKYNWHISTFEGQIDNSLIIRGWKKLIPNLNITTILMWYICKMLSIDNDILKKKNHYRIKT